MKVRFKHGYLEGLGGLLNTVNQTHQLYAQRDPAFLDQLEEALQAAIAIFQQEQKLRCQTAVNGLISDLSALNAGFHPYRFEKIERGEKRNARSIVGLKILHAFQDIVLAEYELTHTDISTAKELLENLVLSYFQQLEGRFFLQRGVETNQEQLEALWLEIGQHKELALYQKKILLSAGFHDVLILLDQLLADLA